ncbi:hypothetical protein [Streptomyces sp. cg2]|uniref:hypothetical protein n=1 Tax=Streptomyces sp. cg2 TaxID=3238799 RepID=UPI0034E24CB9
MSITTDAWATWPEGVIARYLTLAHATVDLTRHDSGDVSCECTGCGYNRSAWAEPVIRDRAQAHAETCRALPRPGRS